MVNLVMIQYKDRKVSLNIVRRRQNVDNGIELQIKSPYAVMGISQGIIKSKDVKLPKC